MDIDTVDMAEVAYANATYHRAAAIAYARDLGEPIAHHKLKPGQIPEDKIPEVPLRSVLYQKYPSLRDHRIAPLWVNMGFGIELGIKGIFLLSKRSKPPCGHNTSKLFGQLDISEQEAVELKLTTVLDELESANVITPGVDRSGLTVQKTLKRFGNDFVNFRYIHEGTSLPDHADSGWVRLRAPSLWFSLEAILRVLRSRLIDAGRRGIDDIIFEPLTSATL